MHDPWPRIIAHADMDAFYAAVEQHDHPELRGKPLLVGPKSGRGVVLTASYEARPYGVGSAMPMAEALRRCPHAVIATPRFDRYEEVSEQVMNVFADFTPRFEAISLDEAFLDMSGASHLFGAPRDMAVRLKRAVFDATGGLHASVGVASTKYVAKVASATCKPKGLSVVPPDAARDWLAPQPISRLWGVGPRTGERLQAWGYHSIGDIARTDPELLRRQLGSAGPHFHALAHAHDPRCVRRRPLARSLGSDRTLASDIDAREDIAAHLKRSADRIGARLRRKRYLAGGVRVKLKTSAFQLLTRQRLLTRPTDVSATLLAAGLSLLDEFDHAGPFRLVGMAAHAITDSRDPRQFDLFEADAGTRRLETTIDSLRERFGDDAVRRARDLDTVHRGTPTLDFLADPD